jgi:two-component system response regulator (stage 0 sporulation protein A)
MSFKYRVVLVDDNQSLTYIIRDQINSLENFEIVGIAHNGEDGIGLINEQKPDLVILDIIMPQVDGLGVLEHFKEDDNIHFIVLSAIGHDLVTKRAVSLGAMYYLIKPFDVNMLVERIQGLILGKEQSSNESEDTEHIKSLVFDEINSVGVPMHVKGYQYLVDAVSLTIKEDFKSLKITKTVYPKLAEAHQTTAISVERAIRNAIDLTLNRKEDLSAREYFNKEMFNNKITNKEFIIRIANAVRNKI